MLLPEPAGFETLSVIFGLQRWRPSMLHALAEHAAPGPAVVCQVFGAVYSESYTSCSRRWRKGFPTMPLLNMGLSEY